jgi:hypothetical protein
MGKKWKKIQVEMQDWRAMYVKLEKFYSHPIQDEENVTKVTIFFYPCSSSVCETLIIYKFMRAS